MLNELKAMPGTSQIHEFMLEASEFSAFCRLSYQGNEGDIAVMASAA